MADEEGPRRSTSLTAAAKTARIVRALPGNKFALNDGTIAEVPSHIRGITVGSNVLYVRGGPGINSGFTKIIGHA